MELEESATARRPAMVRRADGGDARTGARRFATHTVNETPNDNNKDKETVEMVLIEKEMD
ncbi:hypothetical protein M5K25_010304 [Dendrobium thyrsiflorum]|uniref:Uncharacterized protein n=1 Tax=Dendrobium thyrsiflorum TaxID=117978 RepID=A0ABD0UZB0_DENTH